MKGIQIFLKSPFFVSMATAAKFVQPIPIFLAYLVPLDVDVVPIKFHSVPKHFFCGPRKLNIILTQLRNSASFLNFDLFRVGIVSDPSCRCGAALENLKHFFLDCPIYIQARTILISNINRVTTCYTLDIEFLTCGNDNLTYEQNCIIFKYVFDYIKCSKRFLIV
jgi:hypothetical protein